VQHSGVLHGFTTNVCFDPKEKVGAIALLNGIGDAPALAMDLATIARAAVRELKARGLVYRPHPQSRWLILTEVELDDEAFTCDVAATRKRIARLQSYLRRKMLDDGRFICASWRQCRSSISSGCSFKEGYLPHVGKHYDLVRNGQHLRIVVVGQEVGPGSVRS
jgi:hypothetical protein